MNTLFQGNTVTGKDEWLTPPHLLATLGEFDLDPCSPIHRPWDVALKYYTIQDDGLNQKWEGRVWCNPPYGDATGFWLKKCAKHGNAIALVFARSETDWFFRHVWEKADAILFLMGRISFYHVDGKKANSNAGCGSVLIAYGQNNVHALANCGLPGKLIDLRLQR